MRDSIRHGSLGPLYCGQWELVRRIFVTVRDRNWQEVAPTQWNQVVEEPRGVATLSARHKSELVDFEWHGTFRVGADRRSASFAFEGTARTDMDVCRLGLVVLHSPELLIGSRLEVSGPQGEQRFDVPAQISPQPVVDGVPMAMTEPFSVLKVERANLGVLTFTFHGDLFELEDQRNWGDASFKSYCTPLRLGFPRAVKAGARVAHEVEVRFEPVLADIAPGHRPSKSMRSARTGTFPAIGREWRYRSDISAASQHDLPYHHWHVDATAPGGEEALRTLSISSSAKLEIAVADGGEKAPDQVVLSLLRERDMHIARVLVYGAGTALPSAESVGGWRRSLEAVARSRIPLLHATRGYYVEFNRAQAFGAQIDGVAFPLTATVHSDDTGTIIDNVATILNMADTARTLARPAEVVLAPLALYYPNAAGQRDFPRELVVPWLAATIVNAALARITSITLADDVSSAILAMAGDAGAKFLTDLIRCAGHQVAALDEAPPAGVHAMSLTSHEPLRILAVNLNALPARLSPDGLGVRRATVIDAVTGTTLLAAVADVDVPPLSVVWIESVA